MSAQVTKFGFLDMQVCIPDDWTDEQALEFAQREYPAGTTAGWHVRKEGSAFLRGDPERNCCSQRAGFVHLMLDV